jgi:hypothetical protein
MLFAPRIAPCLLAAVERLARKPLSPAEITRRIGREATRRGLARPSYQQVRVLVRQARAAGVRQAPLSGFEVAVGVRVRAPTRVVGRMLALMLPALPLLLVVRRRRS